MGINWCKWYKEEKTQIVVYEYKYDIRFINKTIMVPKSIVDEYIKNFGHWNKKFEDCSKTLHKYISKELSISTNSFMLYGTWCNNLHIRLRIGD